MPAELVRAEQAKRKGRPFVLARSVTTTAEWMLRMELTLMLVLMMAGCSSVIFPQFGQQRASPASAPQYLSQCREQKKASSFDK